MKNVLLFLILCSQMIFSQVFDQEVIFSSGAIEDRINIVILGDGYQSSELAKFITDASNMTNSLFSESPYKEYKEYFNVYAIKVPSNESGVTHPGTATDVTEPDHPVSSVDNYFGSTFDYYNIHRLLVATNQTAITTVLANNFPNYDAVMILANSPYYGGSGGAYAVSSLEASAEQIMIHELGHSFGGLSDEYYAGDIYAAENINITKETNPALVKWKNWIGQKEIGIYQHCCGGESASWYRPHENCKMRFLNAPFCAVCVEGTIEKIHSLTSPIVSYSPDNTSPIEDLGAMDFEVSLINPIPNTLNVSWQLNQEVVGNQTSIKITKGELIEGNNELQVIVTDNTSLLRVNNHETIHFNAVLWNITLHDGDVDTIDERVEFSIFPNPAKDFLSIQLGTENKESFSVKIVDFLGKTLISKDVTNVNDIINIDTSSISKGAYLLKFKFENGLSFSRKIIKE
ncbi:T9SS type A sorting domain-containing protein [Aquimarina sediminis]|uniref:T9SS type A sorting domain-containing protein n=1 Tax=Aquimarina sediminis TaxID=2070536 RepID=UPI000CA0083A|nr:M64 family metallopeptidase [Aquimarina sediminis]